MPSTDSLRNLLQNNSRVVAICATALALFVGSEKQTYADDVAKPRLSGQALREAMQQNPEAAKAIADENGVDWCPTEIRFKERYGALYRGTAACPTAGDCDIPAFRNAEIPDPADPPMVIRLKFNVFANDDGSNPAATQADVDAQVVQLNADFAPSRIQFDYETEFFNNSVYRVFNNIEEAAMKHVYADLPAEQLNVYVVAINEGYIGVGTFPWDPQALQNRGGIIMDDGAFGAGEKTLTHEVGHCLGLWHTHHGVFEVSPCSDCWEYAGDSSDVTGDFCADTEPTPRSFTCSPPGGDDDCNGRSWGETDPQNYMGYGPDNCLTEFTPQQQGRMHCWTETVLASWQGGVKFTADTTFGLAPLEVQFTAVSPKTVNEWIWDFGDGDGSALQSPEHNYAVPGVRDVQVTIDATDGSFSQLRRSYVAVHADTVIGSESIGAPGASAKVSVYAANYLPLFQIRIPFHWSGPLNLTYDSASTFGLRTEALAIQGLTSYDPFNKRGFYTMSANLLNGDPPLAPDTGAVLNLWFSVPPGAAGGANPILFDDYGSNSLSFSYGAQTYLPVVQDGQVQLCARAGDPDASGEITIGDVTYLIARIFSGGPAPMPPNAGDATCNGSTSIEDVTFLISHIFSGGPEPCQCAP